MPVKPFLLLLLFSIQMLFDLPTCKAAFPVQTAAEAEIAPAGHGGKLHEAVTRYISPTLPKPAKESDNGLNGILSFTFGIGGLLAIIAGIITGGGIILLWPAFGIAAVVLGAIGMGKKQKGLAIAGLVLGIIETFIFLLGIVLVIAIAGSYK